MSSRFLDFFVIGAPKCGTTSLYTWLEQHPDTWMPVKEPNFFSRDILNTKTQFGAIKTFDDYLNTFCPDDAANLLKGEATPKYLYSESALDAISKHKQSVKLIALLRNPIDIAIAMHAQNVRQGRELETSFETAWHRGPTSPNDKLTDYAFWARPGIHLQKYFDAFSRDQILVLVLEEDMSQNPEIAYSNVLAFLGLRAFDLNSYQTQNQRRTYRSARLQGLSRRLRRSVYSSLDKIGLAPKRSTGLLKVFDRMNGNRQGAASQPQALRAKIAAQVEDDTYKIAKLLGRRTLPWSDFNWDNR